MFNIFSHQVNANIIHGWMASLIQQTRTWANSRRCERHESLVCCSPCGHEESDTTWQLNNTNKNAN